MKSVILYVAIVAVWAAVLVPMLLRRADHARHGFWLIGRKATADGDIFGETPAETHTAALPPPDGDFARDETTPDAEDGSDLAPDTDTDTDVDADAADEDEEEDGAFSPGRAVKRPRRTRSRGAVMARRRRRTLGLGCLVIAAVVAVSMGVGRWWLTLPPVALLLGHLAMLRAAARVDAERRERMRVARAARIRAEREAASERSRADIARTGETPAARADVIDLTEQRSTREVYDQYVDGLRAVGD